MTMQPAAAALGAYSRDTSPPAENRPICARAKSNVATSMTGMCRPRNSTRLPSERLLASGNSSRHREVALLEHADHGVAHEAGGPEHRTRR